MANRIADIAELTAEQLMLLEDSDLVFEGLPADVDLTVDDGAGDSTSAARSATTPATCRQLPGPQRPLPKCKHKFVAEWGEPVAV